MGDKDFVHPVCILSTAEQQRGYLKEPFSYLINEISLQIQQSSSQMF